MEQGSPSRYAAQGARDGDLLGLLSELIDAHTDTVQLITSDAPTEREWQVHCDYLRALQRLGRATLAHHQRTTGRPPALAIAARLITAATPGWLVARFILGAPARAAHTLPLHPIVQLAEDAPA